MPWLNELSGYKTEIILQPIAINYGRIQTMIYTFQTMIYALDISSVILTEENQTRKSMILSQRAKAMANEISKINDILNITNRRAFITQLHKDFISCGS